MFPSTCVRHRSSNTRTRASRPILTLLTSRTLNFRPTRRATATKRGESVSTAPARHDWRSMSSSHDDSRAMYRNRHHLRACSKPTHADDVPELNVSLSRIPTPAHYIPDLLSRSTSPADQSSSVQSGGSEQRSFSWRE
ncbi:uncharacterized protein MYCGRDRAFT_106715, partial [Zymoseptoria tritici IPO323]